MTTRNTLTLNFKVGSRVVTVRAMDSVGPEDCYDNALRSVLHRYVTSEDLTMPVPREVKDFMIKTNLFI
jgi:hypothetical protein